MMKRNVITGALTALCLSLAGCGTTGTNEPQIPEAPRHPKYRKKLLLRKWRRRQKPKLLHRVMKVKLLPEAMRLSFTSQEPENSTPSV